MKYTIRIIMMAVFIIIGAVEAMAIEEAKYQVIQQEDPFEIRDYEAHILAETIVEGSSKEAGDEGFKRLFSYISGDNRTGGKVAMTAPVSQEPVGEKIKMTAPVGQQRVDETWVVSFMMPASYTLETLPEPTDPKVVLRRVPPRRMAAVRYSGFWSRKKYLQHKEKLESWIQKKGLTIAGDPIWARYDPPFMPWFLRRNEVLIPISSVIGADSDAG